jgi:hypothetical protein
MTFIITMLFSLHHMCEIPVFIYLFNPHLCSTIKETQNRSAQLYLYHSFILYVSQAWPVEYP